MTPSSYWLAQCGQCGYDVDATLTATYGPSNTPTSTQSVTSTPTLTPTPGAQTYFVGGLITEFVTVPAYPTAYTSYFDIDIASGDELVGYLAYFIPELSNSVAWAAPGESEITAALTGTSSLDPWCVNIAPSGTLDIPGQGTTTWSDFCQELLDFPPEWTMYQLRTSGFTGPDTVQGGIGWSGPIGHSQDIEVHLYPIFHGVEGQGGPTPTPGVTPTPDYCNQVRSSADVSAWDGANEFSLPGLAVGQEVCVGFDGFVWTVNIAGITQIGMPSIHFCAIPITFGQFTFMGLTLNLDSIMALLVARVMWNWIRQ